MNEDEPWADMSDGAHTHKEKLVIVKMRTMTLMNAKEGRGGVLPSHQQNLSPIFRSFPNLS